MPAPARTPTGPPALGLHDRWRRAGLGLPPAGLARARWFYWVFAVAVSVSCLPAVLLKPGTGAGVKVAGLASIAALAAVRTVEFRRGRLLSAWSELPQALTLALAANAAGPLSAGVGLFFTGCFFRAVYASTRRTLWSTAGAVAVLGLSAATRVPDWTEPFISQALGIAGATVLTRVLVDTLTRQNAQAQQGERLLSAVFDNLDVAVTVGASPGAPAIMNRAARDLNEQLGVTGTSSSWQETIAVYGADGRTPLRPEQLPAALALTGAPVRDMAVAVGVVDGARRYFSVNATRFADLQSSSRAVVTVHEVTEQRQAQAELAHLATHDPLTGLANRSLLTRAIEDAAGDPREDEAVVILLDLDGFKRINDTLGHAFGDEVLQTVAKRLQSSLRPEDLIARLGGDEFAMLVRDSDGAPELAQRICQVLGEPMSLRRSRVSVSASVGVVRVLRDQDADAVLAAADLAMYAAKTAGPGRVKVFRTDMRHVQDERLHLEADLHQALEDGQFELHYQPYVSLATGTTTGTEALVRWRHPTRGLVPPLQFIPLVEDTSMIVPLGRWILRTACAVGASFQPDDPAQLRTMSVNVSARQLEDLGIVADVAQALADSGLPAPALVLEITESVLVDHSPIVLERLRALKGLGVKIAVDDFGTGYSSLSRLRTFPFDILKIDQSFVVDVENATGNALVRAIVAMADALGLGVVAEGVETAGQAMALAALGCGLAQGYYFARPTLPAALQWPASPVTA